MGDPSEGVEVVSVLGHCVVVSGVGQHGGVAAGGEGEGVGAGVGGGTEGGGQATGEEQVGLGVVVEVGHGFGE